MSAASIYAVAEKKSPVDSSTTEDKLSLQVNEAQKEVSISWLESAESNTQANDLPETIYEDVINTISNRIKEDDTLRRNWKNLGGFAIFIFIYALVLYLQLQPNISFEVQTTIHEAVFTSESGLLDANDKVVNRVSSQEAAYQVLERSLLSTFSRVTCGDGVCSEGEKPWYANIGCANDCGVFRNTSKVKFRVVWHSTGNRRLTGADGAPDEEDENDSIEIRLCEEAEEFCFPFKEVSKGDTLEFTGDLYDGDWEVHVSGAGKSAEAVNCEIFLLSPNHTAMAIANESAWSEDASKQEQANRHNPIIIYQEDPLVSWFGCRRTSQGNYYTGSQRCSSSCNTSWLGDGVCDDACNNKECSWDNGDCCILQNNALDELKFKLRQYTKKEKLSRGDVSVFNRKTTPSEIYLGPYGANRLLGGLLVTQSRKTRIPCKDSKAEYFGDQSERFHELSTSCSISNNNDDAYEYSYGFDPLYLPASNLYHSEFKNNINQLYSAEESNMLRPKTPLQSKQTPYGFIFEKALTDYGGYGVYFNLDLSYAECQQRVEYLRDGKFIDGNTKEVSIRAMTFNADLNVFTRLHLKFESKSSGIVEVNSYVNSINVQPYRFSLDAFRLFLELSFLGMLLVSSVLESLELVSLCRCKKFSDWRLNLPQRTSHGWIFPRWTHYFESLWNYLDFFNLGLLLFSAFRWFKWATVTSYKFSPQLLYHVYSPTPLPGNPALKARWFTNVNETELQKLATDFTELDSMTLQMEYYSQLHGVSFLIMLFRTLKMVSFQQRLSLVTDTLYEAAGDLLHWCMIALIVTVGYAFLGTLYLGHRIEAFQTFSNSFLSCCLIGWMGELGILDDIGSNDVPGQLFFWTYIFLNFFVLLNILLAIIVDSYAIVKERLSREIENKLTAQGQHVFSELSSLVLGGYGCGCDRNRANLERLIKQQLSCITTEDHTSKVYLRMSKNNVVDVCARKVNSDEVDERIIDKELLKDILKGGLLNAGDKGSKNSAGEVDVHQLSADIIKYFGYKEQKYIKKKEE